MFAAVRHAAAVAVLAVTAAAGAAEAKVYNAAMNAATQAVVAPTFLVLGNPGAMTAMPVTVPAAGVYLISFTAECMVSSTTAYATVDILVDGIAQGITAGNDDAFCSSNTTAAFDRPDTHSIVLPVFLTAGAHRVQVRASVLAGAAQARFDDLAIALSD